MSLIIIGGLFKGRKIKTLPSLETRPSSSKCRAAVFNICQNEIEGACFFDLYAGSGAMGLEALSRGARRSIFIENNRKEAKCIEENIALLNLQSKTKLICQDVLLGLKKITEKGDIIYIDPPYKYYEKEGFIQKLLSSLLDLSLLNDNCLIFFEAPSTFELVKDQCDFKQISIHSVRRYGFSSLIEMSYRN